MKANLASSSGTRGVDNIPSHRAGLLRDHHVLWRGTPTPMRKTLVFLLVLFSAIQFGTANEQPVPTFRILPEDVVQDSVHQWRMSTNNYAVSWIYTEAGAKKMLAFRETHQRQKVRTVVGSFESPPGEIMQFRPMPPAFTPWSIPRLSRNKREMTELTVQIDKANNPGNLGIHCDKSNLLPPCATTLPAPGTVRPAFVGSQRRGA